MYLTQSDLPHHYFQRAYYVLSKKISLSHLDFQGKRLYIRYPLFFSLFFQFILKFFCYILKMSLSMIYLFLSLVSWITIITILLLLQFPDYVSSYLLVQWVFNIFTYFIKNYLKELSISIICSICFNVFIVVLCIFAFITIFKVYNSVVFYIHIVQTSKLSILKSSHHLNQKFCIY